MDVLRHPVDLPLEQLIGEPKDAETPVTSPELEMGMSETAPIPKELEPAVPSDRSFAVRSRASGRKLPLAGVSDPVARSSEWDSMGRRPPPLKGLAGRSDEARQQRRITLRTGCGPLAMRRGISRGGCRVDRRIL